MNNWPHFFLLTWPKGPCELFDISRLSVNKLFTFISSPLKLPGQLKPNLARMTFVRSSTKISDFILISKRNVFFGWLNIFSSQNTSSNNLLVCTDHVCEVLCKNSSFCPDPAKKTNMTAMSNSCFELAKIL